MLSQAPILKYFVPWVTHDLLLFLPPWSFTICTSKLSFHPALFKVFVGIFVEREGTGSQIWNVGSLWRRRGQGNRFPLELPANALLPTCWDPCPGPPSCRTLQWWLCCLKPPGLWLYGSAAVKDKCTCMVMRNWPAPSQCLWDTVLDRQSQLSCIMCPPSRTSERETLPKPTLTLT